MAPEQARGEIQAIDARSDIYALGATLFCKLTGRYPFQATNVVDVLHAVLHQEPPLPRSLNASIPRCLETIVMRCLQKTREDRYQTADEVIGELDRFMADDHAEPESSAWFRHLVGQHDSAPAVEPADDAAADPFGTVSLEIVREIAAWDADLYRVSGSLERSFGRLDQVRSRLDSILQERPDTAWARFYRGVALFRRGRLDEAAEDMERAIDRVRDLAGAYFELGRLYLALYLKEHRLARRHISQTGIEHGLTSARGRVDQAVVALSEAQRFPGEVPAWIEPYARAVERLAERDPDGCVAICGEILAEDPDVEEVWKLCGDAQRLAGRDPFESYRRALAVRRSYFEALFAMAEAHLAHDQITEAREALERARAIHPEFVEAVALLGRTYLAEARARDDIEALQRAHKVATEACALDGLSYDALVTLAEVALERGRREASDTHFAEAIAALERAEKLDGCGNRVKLLKTTGLLERVRLDRAAPDARSRLEEILAFCRESAAQAAENETWRSLTRDVERELAART
jgi:tetratricopeptide (TPR) repeat protein